MNLIFGIASVIGCFLGVAIFYFTLGASDSLQRHRKRHWRLILHWVAISFGIALAVIGVAGFFISLPEVLRLPSRYIAAVIGILFGIIVQLAIILIPWIHTRLMGSRFNIFCR